MKFLAVYPKVRFFCAIFAVAVVLFAGYDVLAQGVATQDQWLVLNNGQTLQGKVTFVEGRYSVVTATGSRIFVTKENTNFVADSIKDIYWEKWSRVDPSDATSHISLFRWCLKHGLLDEAQNQIDLVAKIDELESQAEHMLRMAQELELVVARIEKEALLAKSRQQRKDMEIRSLPQLPTSINSGFAVAPQIPLAPIDAEGRPVRALRSSMAVATPPENKIELVDFEEAFETVARRTKPAWVNNRQLDRETRSMPDGTVAYYKRHLEQKLIANCASCHDSRSASMPFSQRSFGQTIPRRMSQQNLHFLMEQVDRSNPLASPLLLMATTAHGDQKSAAFRSSDAFVFEIKKWTIAVSNDPSRWLMELGKESQAANAAPKQIEKESLRAEAKPMPAAIPEAPIIIESAESDPYDPSAFNRK